jgi:hypothetical protein
MTIRDWLRKNGHEATLALIDEVMVEFTATGSRERCNWADVLSGGKDGNAITVAGRTFPVLRAAQLSRGKEVTPNAIWSDQEHDEFPSARKTGRWPAQKRRRLPAKAQRAAKKPSRKVARHARAS